MLSKIYKNKLKIKELLKNQKNKKHIRLNKLKKINNNKRLPSKHLINNSKIYQKRKKIRLKK